MVILHPSGTPAKGMAPYAQLLAAHGAVVIVIDAPYFRRGGTSSLLWTSQDRYEQIQLIKDLQRAVDVLIATGKVDPARIGFDGYSYGGILGAGFVGIERRLKAAVLVVGDGGLVSHFTNPEDSYLPGLGCSTRLAWFRAMAPIEPIRFIPHAPPTALLLQSGRLDDLVPPADAGLLHAAAPQPRTIRWYDAGHGLDLQALIDRHEWLNGQIGLDLL